LFCAIDKVAVVGDGSDTAQAASSAASIASEPEKRSSKKQRPSEAAPVGVSQEAGGARSPRNMVESGRASAETSTESNESLSISSIIFDSSLSDEPERNFFAQYNRSTLNMILTLDLLYTGDGVPSVRHSF